MDTYLLGRPTDYAKGGPSERAADTHPLYPQVLELLYTHWITSKTHDYVNWPVDFLHQPTDGLSVFDTGYIETVRARFSIEVYPFHRFLERVWVSHEITLGSRGQSKRKRQRSGDLERRFDSLNRQHSIVEITSAIGSGIVFDTSPYRTRVGHLADRLGYLFRCMSVTVFRIHTNRYLNCTNNPTGLLQRRFPGEQSFIIREPQTERDTCAGGTDCGESRCFQHASAASVPRIWHHKNAVGRMQFLEHLSFYCLRFTHDLIPACRKDASLTDEIPSCRIAGEKGPCRLVAETDR